MKYSIFFILPIVSACHFISKESNKNLDKSDSTFEIVKDIPIDKNGRYPRYYKLKNTYEKKIGLTSLENGFDSMEIRIHYDVALAYEGQTITLQKTKLGWIGRLYYEKYNYFGNDSLLISSSEKTVYPKSGWNNFIKELYDLNILTLRDASEINNYDGCNDGDGVLIQIATKTKYRIYRYPCFTYSLHTEEILQVKKVEKILQTLENELNFKRVQLKLQK